MEQIISLIKTLAYTIPLDVFVFIGSFMEEIIAPIPSPLVMTTAGTLAHTQNHTLLHLPERLLPAGSITCWQIKQKI